jgi:excisionase family DNA binding protein
MKTHLSQLKAAGGSQDSPSNTNSPASLPVGVGLWTPRIAANYCGFQSAETLLRAYREGKLPAYKLGLRSVRFDPRDVKAWIERARVSL